MKPAKKSPKRKPSGKGINKLQGKTLATSAKGVTKGRGKGQNDSNTIICVSITTTKENVNELLLTILQNIPLSAVLGMIERFKLTFSIIKSIITLNPVTVNENNIHLFKKGIIKRENNLYYPSGPFKKALLDYHYKTV